MSHPADMATGRTPRAAWVLPLVGGLCLGVTAASASPRDEKGSQQEINHCLWEEYQAADRELNQIWQKLKAAAERRDSEEEPRLRGLARSLLEAQRGWLAYRTGHCASVGFEMRGGTGERMLVNGCLARMTRERVMELKEMLR